MSIEDTDVDKNVWIKKEALLDIKKYYSIVLVYGDDILCTHKDALVVIDALTSIYVMEQGSMGPPERYLGSNIEKVQTQDGKVMWANHSGDYCKSAIVYMEKTLAADEKTLSQYGGSRNSYP